MVVGEVRANGCGQFIEFGESVIPRIKIIYSRADVDPDE